MQIVYHLLYGLWYLLSLLPMRVHYVLSDLLYLIIYRLAHYRIRVVKKNLQESFPDKSDEELRYIERDFYRIGRAHV